jgi:hypothetical protein
MWFQDWITSDRKFIASKSVRGVTTLKNDDKLVLFRRPYPETFSRQGAYIPHAFRENAAIGENAMLTEDEIIASLGKQTMSMIRKPGEFVHPADYMYNGMNPIPHPKYTCNGCNEVGKHFRRDCPTNASNIDSEADDGNKFTRGLDRVPRPHGIPKSFLRKISKPEDGGSGVMRDESGTFYVLDTGAMNKRKERKTEMGEKERRRERENEHVELGFTIEKHMDTLDAREEDAKDAFYAEHPQKRHKKQSTCTHWLSGLCVKGSLECDHLHSALPEHMPICKFFSKGMCSNEDLCMFRHVKPPCPMYVKGFCPKGDACQLTHTERNMPLRSEWDATTECSQDDFCFLRDVLRETQVLRQTQFPRKTQQRWRWH